MKLVSDKNQNIVVGSIVRLKSGGPQMTVFHTNWKTARTGDIPLILCNWFNESILVEYAFDPSQLFVI